MTISPVENELPLSGSGGSSYLERLLNLLEVAIVAENAPLTLTEISQRAQVPLSTASRLVSQLVSWDFLADGGASRFIAGSRLVRMSLTVSEGLHSVDALARATRTLSAVTGESVTAGLLVGNTLLIVARTESHNSLRAVNRIGENISPTFSALGKAMLSRMPEEKQLQLVRSEVGDRADSVLFGLRKELSAAMVDGYAVDEETYAVGLRCRAAAVIARDGTAIGGISIGGPAARFTHELADAAVPHLLVETASLSADIDSTAMRGGRS
jgi:IclR family acetate operon transcriptional repressor